MLFIQQILPILLRKLQKKVGFDLLFFGEGSGDLYAQQTGLAVGEYLGLPCQRSKQNYR